MLCVQSLDVIAITFWAHWFDACAIDRIELEVIHESNPKFGKKSHKVVLTSRGSGPLLRSESYGFNDLAAFDDAVENLELQIRKVHERSKEILRGSIRKETSI